MADIIKTNSMQPEGKNIPSLADSAEIYTACEKIGQKLNLHINQIGEVDAQIRQVLRGTAQAKNFTSDIKRLLEIDDDLAKKITSEVNTEVFQTIRAKMQSQADAQQSSANSTSIEKAGGFSIEPQNGQTATDENVGITPADKDKILSDIENPMQSKATLAKKEPEESHTEPLVDQLLSAPTSKPIEKVAAPAPENLPTEAPKAPAPPKGPDAYREPIK